MKKGAFQILLAGVCWGIFPLFTSGLYSTGVDSLTAAAMRAYMAAAIYLLIAVKGKVFHRIKARDIPFFAVYGLCSVTFVYISYLTAIRLLSVSLASVLLFTSPAFVILLSRLFFGEPITRRKVVALALTLVGCMLVVKIYAPGALQGSLPGIFFGLLSGISFSTLTLFGRVGLKKYDGQVNAIVPALFGALFFLPVLPIWKVQFTLPRLGLFLGQSFVGSVLPFTLYLGGMQRGVEGGDASVLATVEPLVATLSGVLFLHERLAPLQVLGVVLVLTGALFPVLQSKKGKAKGEKALVGSGKARRERQ